MRTLFRNKTELYFADPVGEPVEIIDDGCLTGNFVQAYSTPTRLDLCIMPKGGEADVQRFGADTSYTLVALGDIDCPLNEQSRVWINKDITKAHNYIVKKVYKSLNSVRYALQEVNVT